MNTRRMMNFMFTMAGLLNAMVWVIAYVNMKGNV